MIRGWRIVVPLLLLCALFTNSCEPEVIAEAQTYSGVNTIRVHAGLPALVADRYLALAAHTRSADMAAHGYFSHTPPDGCTFLCVLDDFGIAHAYSGENIAWNNWDWSQSALVAVAGWRDSPPHLENILNCHYQRFGSGVVKAADGKVYYTMIFEGNASC